MSRTCLVAFGLALAAAGGCVDELRPPSVATLTRAVDAQQPAGMCRTRTVSHVGEFDVGQRFWPFRASVVCEVQGVSNTTFHELRYQKIDGKWVVRPEKPPPVIRCPPSGPEG